MRLSISARTIPILYAAAVVGALVFGVLYGWRGRHDGAGQVYFWYNPPAFAAGAGLVAERVLSLRQSGTLRMLSIDGLMFTLGIGRALTGFPPASGHALAAAYILLTARFAPTRVLGAILLLLTCYTKIVIWHWDPTLWSGLLLGTVLALFWRRESKLVALSPRR